jgi:hypothetical protein
MARYVSVARLSASQSGGASRRWNDEESGGEGIEGIRLWAVEERALAAPATCGKLSKGAAVKGGNACCAHMAKNCCCIANQAHAAGARILDDLLALSLAQPVERADMENVPLLAGACYRTALSLLPRYAALAPAAMWRACASLSLSRIGSVARPRDGIFACIHRGCGWKKAHHAEAAAITTAHRASCTPRPLWCGDGRGRLRRRHEQA